MRGKSSELVSGSRRFARHGHGRQDHQPVAPDQWPEQPRTQADADGLRRAGRRDKYPNSRAIAAVTFKSRTKAGRTMPKGRERSPACCA